MSVMFIQAGYYRYRITINKAVMPKIWLGQAPGGLSCNSSQFQLINTD